MEMPGGKSQQIKQMSSTGTVAKVRPKPQQHPNIRTYTEKRRCRRLCPQKLQFEPASELN